MKKTRFLALTLAVVLMLMGAGYAFWTEALKIEGTVDTGELDFEFTDESFKPIITGEAYDGKYVSGSAEVIEDGHALDLIFTNLYPGATAKVNFCIENTGTIGLKIENFEFEGDDPNLEELVVVEDGARMSIAEYFETLEGTFIDVENKLCKEVVFSVNKCADEEDFNELAEFEFSVEAIVKQYNDDGSCDEEEPGEPDPVGEITGLRFEKSSCVKKGSYCNRYVEVSGTFYYTWSEGEDTYAGAISKEKIYYTYWGGGSKTFSYGDFSITLEVDGYGNPIGW